MNKKSIIIILLSIVILATPLIATTQAFFWKRCVTPVDITLTMTPSDTGSFYVTPFSEAWSYKYKYIIANDLTTTAWIGNLQTPGGNTPFTSTMIMDVLVKAEVNLETTETMPMEPVACSWGMAVVKAIWTFEGDTFEGRIVYKYDYVDALDYSNFGPYDYWVPRPQYIECHYYGILYSTNGQQLRLFGANVAGDFTTNFEGYLIEY